LFLSPDMIETERLTYGLGQMIGETGGLFKFLDFFFTFFFGLVSPIRLFPYLAAALYRDDEEEQTMIDKFLAKKDILSKMTRFMTSTLKARVTSYSVKE
jgi:hypothetical protein